MTTTETSSTPPRYERIPLAQLVPSPNNPRQLFDEAKLKELGMSLTSAVGQQVPILVRAHPKQPLVGVLTYEILDGERRFRAAKAAKLPDLECKIVVVTDAVALEITVIANLQRQDITPIEEANGVRTLLAAGRDVEDVAKDLGKSVAWVYLRAKLADLSPAWRKAIADPKDEVFQWSANKLELIARFPIPQQDEMLKEWDVKETQTHHQLEKIIDRDYLRSLKVAPWALDDVKLVPKAGACVACPKRTSCQQELFAVAKDDRCTDGDCWSAKDAAHLTKRESELREKHPDLVKVDRSSYGDEDGVLGFNKIQDAKKSDPKAVPALVVGGSGRGTVIYIKPRAAGGGHSSSSNGRPTGSVPVKDRLEQRLKARRLLKVAIVKHLLAGCSDLPDGEFEDLGPGKLVDMGFGTIRRPSRTVLVAMATAFGLHLNWKFNLNHEPLEEESWADLLAHLDLPAAELDEKLWQRCIHQIAHNGSLDFEDDIEPICKLVGLDAAKIHAAVMIAKPLPRTLAAIYEEDGTPRKGVGRAAKPAAAAKAAAKKPAKKATPAKAAKPGKKAKKARAGAA